MLKLSGLVLDSYDDAEGGVLREIFPTVNDIPESIKTAHALQPEERAALPDDLFALVITGGDVELRKFACIDKGNTELSMQYFLKTAHRLPPAAQKVAAENLVKAAGWYGVTPPEEVTKIALGLGTAMTAISLPSVVKGTSDQVKRNLSVARASGGVVNPSAAG